MKTALAVLVLLLCAFWTPADSLPAPMVGSTSLASAAVPIASPTGIDTGLILSPEIDGSLYSLTFSLTGLNQSEWNTPLWIFTADGVSYQAQASWDAVTFTFPSFSGTQDGKLIIATSLLCSGGCIEQTPQNWYDFGIDPPAQVSTPEPASLALLVSGLLWLAWLATKRRRASNCD
jgi:hypothetical protein